MTHRYGFSYIVFNLNGLIPFDLVHFLFFSFMSKDTTTHSFVKEQKEETQSPNEIFEKDKRKRSARKQIGLAKFNR